MFELWDGNETKIMTLEFQGVCYYRGHKKTQPRLSAELGFQQSLPVKSDYIWIRCLIFTSGLVSAA